MNMDKILEQVKKIAAQLLGKVQAEAKKSGLGDKLKSTLPIPPSSSSSTQACPRTKAKPGSAGTDAATSAPASGDPSPPPKRADLPRRPMKFPYTFSAKIAQFPIHYYRKHNWIWRYYLYAVIGSVPVFWYISGMSNSKSNKATWKKIRQQEAEEHKHRH